MIPEGMMDDLLGKDLASRMREKAQSELDRVNKEIKELEAQTALGDRDPHASVALLSLRLEKERLEKIAG